jgi:amidase
VSPDYEAALKADTLKGKRFGVLREAMGYHPGVDASVERAIVTLKAAGADVVDVTIPGHGRWSGPENEVLLYEFKDGLNAYLRKSGAPQASLEALIAWNRANAARAMPFFGQELFEQAQAKGPLTDAAYLKARDAARRLAGQEGLLAALEAGRLDAVIAPSTGPAWPTDHVLGDHFTGAGYGVAAVAGTPSLTVPAGEVQGLPVGITFMSRPYTEAELLGFGFAFEQATKARSAPQFKATIEE